MLINARLDLVCKILLTTQPVNNLDLETLSSVFNSIRSKVLSGAVYPHLCGHLEFLRTADDSASSCGNSLAREVQS